MNAIERAAKELAEARKALLCLALEVPPQVHADVRAKVEAAFAALAAEPAERADQWPKLIERGDTVAAGHIVLRVNKHGTLAIERGPMHAIPGVAYWDYGPAPLPPQEQARG